MDNIGRTVASSVILATNLKGEVGYRTSHDKPEFAPGPRLPPAAQTISYRPLGEGNHPFEFSGAWRDGLTPVPPTVSDQEQQIIAMVDEYLEKCVEQVVEKSTKVFFKGLFFFAIFAFVFIVGRWSAGL
jgi:hypothetical protein